MATVPYTQVEDDLDSEGQPLSVALPPPGEEEEEEEEQQTQQHHPLSTTRRFGFPNPDKDYFRYVILVCSCLLTFGSYFSFDLPSTLQESIQNRLHISDGGIQYQSLYASYSYSNMLMVIAGGYIIDKWGNRIGTLLFTTLITIGQTLFALGGTVGSYPLSLCGRLIFGSGGGPITVVQNNISSQYFKGKELALAFGVTLTASRLGSILNFLLSPTIKDSVGLSMALWFGTILCCLSFLCGLTFIAMDRRNEKGGHAALTTKERRIKFADIKKFPPMFWVLCFICQTFYLTIFPFIAIATKYFQDKYDYSDTKAGRIAGIVYYFGMVVSPFLGHIVDRIGHRAHLAFLGSAITLPTFLLFAQTDISPVLPMLLLGVGYSVSAATIWPSVPLVVELHTVGTAMGVMTAIQMGGVAVANVIVGALKRSHGYNADVYFFLACGAMATVLTLILNIMDMRSGTILNRAHKKEASGKPDAAKALLNPATPSSEETTEGEAP